MPILTLLLILSSCFATDPDNSLISFACGPNARVTEAATSADNDSSCSGVKETLSDRYCVSFQKV